MNGKVAAKKDSFLNKLKFLIEMNGKTVVRTVGCLGEVSMKHKKRATEIERDLKCWRLRGMTATCLVVKTVSKLIKGNQSKRMMLVFPLQVSILIVKLKVSLTVEKTNQVLGNSLNFFFNSVNPRKPLSSVWL